MPKRRFQEQFCASFDSNVMNPAKPYRILVADDHAVARHGLMASLVSLPEIEIVGEAKTGSQAIQLAIKLKPDLVILDLGLKELNGIEVVRAIRTVLPETEVLVVSLLFSPEIATIALRAGARGYLGKSDSREELITAVQNVCRRFPHVSSRFPAKSRIEAKFAGLDALPDPTLTSEQIAAVLVRSEMKMHDAAAAMLRTRRNGSVT